MSDRALSIENAQYICRTMHELGSELTYKEMYRQPASFQAVNDTLEDIFKTLDKVFFSEKKYDELIFTGCGTSLYLAQASAAAFSTYTGIPSKGVPCSELYYFPETYVKKEEMC